MAPSEPGDEQPDVFQKGVAISVWQNASDNMLSNWTRYAYGTWPFNRWPWKLLCLPFSPILNGHKPGKSSHYWERYAEDIELTKKLGCNAFRFSFEWARIEPQKGVYDQEAIKTFHKMLDEMERFGIEPSATLWHFTHPLWFEDLGGFEKEENLQHFVDYCKFVFKEYGHRIRLWATMNEPTCYSFLGYLTNMSPPGFIMNFRGAATVLMNLLKAHVLVYKALKAMEGGEKAQIGLVHHHITFKPRENGWLYYPVAHVCEWMTYWWGWDILDKWMKTGEYECKLPFWGCVSYKEPGGKPPCDWWGINYYSRPVLHWTFTTTCMPGEVMTDMYYPIYPEGLYTAIVRSSAYKIPMYVTETGIADKKDDRRAIMIDAYLGAMMRAIADGYDVRGMYYWTLVDNFEWSTGFNMRFGLYHWESDFNIDRVLKEGAKAMVRFYTSVPDKLKELKAIAVKEWRGDPGSQAVSNAPTTTKNAVAGAKGVTHRARAAAGAAVAPS